MFIRGCVLKETSGESFTEADYRAIECLYHGQEVSA